MNKNYDLSWELNQPGTISLINRTISFNYAIPTQTRTYTLPVEYKDLDSIDVEMTVTWGNNETNRKYTGLGKYYNLQCDFEAPSIAIEGGATETLLSFATKSSPNIYDAVNPWAHGLLPLDPKLPWKAVSYSTTDTTITGAIKATINNPYKNSTKDTYLHGTMNVGAEYYYPATPDSPAKYDTEVRIIYFDIDNNVLTVRANVPPQYSLSISVKMTGHRTCDIA